jgi:ADP-ribose pyrophosphatase YjhB (NUDIX family)
MEQSTRIAGGVVIDADGNILVVNQGGVHWSLPKGHIEPGEGAVEAARREIGEEAGIDNLTFVKELGTYERYRMNWDGSDNPDELKTIEMFLFTTSQGELHPRDPANPSARWIPKSEVVNTLTHPKDKEFFRSIYDAIG